MKREVRSKEERTYVQPTVRLPCFSRSPLRVVPHEHLPSMREGEGKGKEEGEEESSRCVHLPSLPPLDNILSHTLVIAV